MKIITTERIPIKSWCNSPEEGALEQAKNLANLPFTFKQVCLMPDTHTGYGMPIGGVIACKGAVIPNAVGVDIGCGMSAIQTNTRSADVSADELRQIIARIRELVPVGFNHHAEPQLHPIFDEYPEIPIVKQELQNAKFQLGTLGGGNHFIEIQKDEKGFMWIMIHSGSRNFGYKIAKEYNQKAQKLCKMWYSNIPAPKGEDGLAFLPIGTQEAREYLAAMKYALVFALHNRDMILSACKTALKEVLGDRFLPVSQYNIHHNYASFEKHFGENVIVHRKGATSAQAGEIGIIPGSQGTASYIVRGLGNPQSFMSCSHGSGRKLGRREAQRSLNLDEERRKMDEKGIIHSLESVQSLDEAPGAYKDIENVMQEQSDLVEPVHRFTPLAVIKA